MHLIKRINKEYLLLAVFIAIFLASRLPGLYGDTVNPDSVNWHWRAEQFVVGLKQLQLEKTYQHYQPGTTLMWIVGPTVELIKQFNGDLVYNQNTFLVFDYVSKVVLVFVQLELSILGIFLLTKIVDFKKAWLVFFVFSMEPFFLANSRVLHLDVLLTLLLFIGLLLSYLHLKKFNWWYGILAGVFLALATLTKSVAVGGILFAVGVGGLWVFLQRGWKESLKFGLSILIPSLVAFFVFLPALLVNTKEVLLLIYDGIERVGIRRGHSQTILGQDVRDGGVGFYPLVFLLKTSPFSLLLLILSLFGIKASAKKEKKKLNLKFPSLTLFLTIFFIGYLVAMTIATKKIDRYFLPVYPYLALLGVLGLYDLWGKLRVKAAKYLKVVLAIFFVAFVVYPFFSLYPYHFTYTNPFFGSPQFVHEKILAQKPFGVGMPALKDEILKRYGFYPTLGFVDIKPMEAIYKASRVYDVNVDGTRNYDLMVLGTNEEVPQKVLDSDNKFVLDHIMYINGLEYWKIYVKASKP